MQNIKNNIPIQNIKLCTLQANIFNKSMPHVSHIILFLHGHRPLFWATYKIWHYNVIYDVIGKLNGREKSIGMFLILLYNIIHNTYKYNV